MCKDCFNSEIHSFVSEDIWLEKDKEISIKLSKGIFRPVSKEEQTSKEKELDGTVFECLTCKQRWIIHDPDHADRGFLLRVTKTNLIRSEINIKNLDLFDEIFSEIGLEPLLTNPKFKLGESSSSEYLKFWTKDEIENVSMLIEVFTGGVTFYIDRANEIFDWSTEQIEKNVEGFKEVVKDIFTCPLEIEHKGNKTTLKFMDSNNNSKRTIKSYEGLWPSFFDPKSVFYYKPFA
jgi:hypothetical protein